jgi:hypothetical protein
MEARLRCFGAPNLGAAAGWGHGGAAAVLWCPEPLRQCSTGKARVVGESAGAVRGHHVVCAKPVQHG